MCCYIQLLVPHGEEFDSNGAAITAMEKSLLLAFALKWRQQSDRLNTEQIQDLEKKIWLSHIHSAMDKIENSVRYSIPFCVWMILLLSVD